MNERNTLPRIDTFLAAVSVDKDGEGLIGMLLDNGMMMPLIAADPARYEFVRTQAESIAHERGILVQIVRFVREHEGEAFDGRR